MKKELIVGLMSAAVVVGCGKKEESAPAKPATPAPAPQASAPAAPPAPAAPAPPAPGAPAAAPAAAAQVDPLAGMRQEKSGGENLNDLRALQFAVDTYQRAKAAQGESGGSSGNPWPPLDAEMNALVQYRIVRAIPQAPDGKKYVYNKDTGKVEVK